MTTTQTKAIVMISELLVELTKEEMDETKLIKLNAAHFILVKLAKNLADHDTVINAEA